MNRQPLLLLSCFLLAAACSDELPEPAASSVPPTPGPGSTAWEDDDITCENQDDCNPGEVCTDGKCHIQRCADQSYSSAPPLGKTLYFQMDQEIMVARGGVSSPRIETYEAMGDTFVSPDDSSLWATGAEPSDLAGGNFLGAPPEVVAIIQPAKKHVRFVADGIDQEMPLDIFPIAVGGGDIDLDGVDELGAANLTGEFVICDATTGQCPHYGDIAKLVGFDVQVFDVTMGDVDGDGRAELAFVGWPKTSDSSFVVGVYNPDHEETGQPEMIHTQLEGTAKRISAGDLDGDKVAELFALDDGAWGNQVHWLQMDAGTISAAGTIDVASDAIDILATDIDSDDRADVMVLTDSDQVEVYNTSGTAGLSLRFTTGLSMTQEAKRLAVVDRDGDSPAGALMEGPRLVPGKLVPVSVAIYPPYSREHSDGTSSTTIGSKESSSQSASETVSLSASLTVGVEGEIPGVVKTFVGGRISESVEMREEVKQSIVMWSRFHMEASPAVEGLHNGGVMLGCGCFHAYKYRVQDPAGVLEGLGDTMDVYVPTGGQSHVMSIQRYNAMAEAVGDLPIIEVPYAIGDPASYPSAPETLEGGVIDHDDLVFTPSDYRVSDTAKISWRYTIGKTESNSVSTTTYVAAVAEAKFAFGVGVGVKGEVGVGVGHGYSISVGESAMFSGAVPPIRDDPNTPEDEFALYNYGFSPIVYRQRYVDYTGAETGYYVQTYTVTP